MRKRWFIGAGVVGIAVAYSVTATRPLPP
ncbi:MAG: hypothetical protein ACI83E_003040, partial [Sulfitobacter sp.]